MAGAREVVPVASAEEAVRIASRLGLERTLLCGERGGRKIDGFHLGNSPAEYTPGVIAGKTLVLATSNGSHAFIAARHADTVLCGALLNASSVAQTLHEHQADRVTLLCAGTGGHFSFEDCLAAGAIVSALQSLNFRTVQLRDSARAASILFESERQDLTRALRCGDHGSHLIDIGFDGDIEYCAQLDIDNAPVPRMTGSTIRIYDDSASRRPETVAEPV
jgi:2-phosphosulfolactate phosphatase